MQENDAALPEIAQGFLDVTHRLPIGVEPVDQSDVDGVLLEERPFALEEGVAGRLEVVDFASLCVGEFAGARRKLECWVDGNLHVGADSLERLSSRNTDLQINR